MKYFNKISIELHISKVILKAILLALLVLTNCSTAIAANLTSTVNRNTMQTNETLNLTVTYDDQADSSALDLSALNRDFEVLGVSPRSSTSIQNINGKSTRTATTQWNIVLAAKREGELTIPAFKIKQAVSKVIKITAANPSGIGSNSGANTSQSSAPLIATGLAQKISVYPNEQLIYQIELSAAANVTDLNGSTLEIPGASVELISQSQFQQIDNGIARNIVSLKYAIFAQQSGTLKVPSLSFTGLVGARRSIFGNQGQKVIARTKPIDIEVKAKPASNNHKNTAWFPAQSVQIGSSWSADKNAINTGEPITRTITVRATGQLATAIPPLNSSNVASAAVKSYKDKPQLSSQKTNDGYISTRIESEAIVVNTAGQIELPAISVDWFNVETNYWEKAVLPAETITVSGSATSSTVPITTPVAVAQQSQSNNNTSTHWAWPIATGILSLICLMQFFLLLKVRKSQPKQTIAANENKTEKALWKTLSEDLNGNNPSKIRSSFVAWTTAAHPHLRNKSLSAVYNQPDSELMKSIEKLEAILFEENSEHELSDFKGQLKQQIEAYRNELGKDKTKQGESLEPLYLSA